MTQSVPGIPLEFDPTPDPHRDQGQARPTILEIDGLVKDYPGGRRALDGVSLRVSSSELVVVLGSNGSGKSTLLRCAVRLIDPTAGSVRVAGRDLARLRGRELREARRP